MRTSSLVLGLAATSVCVLQETEAQTLVTRVYHENDIGSYAFDPPFWTYYSNGYWHSKSSHWLYHNHRYVFIDISVDSSDLIASDAGGSAP